MKQLIFNSFPRCGNVYSAHCSNAFMDSDYSTVHIPEIFSIEEIHNITIFRKPEDAISSLINKQLESSPPGTIPYFSNNSSNIDKHIILYRKYIEYATKYKDLIYIGRFEDLIENTVLHFENISKWCNKPLYPDYKERFEKLSFIGRTWQDKHDGHIPRGKGDIRLKIEEQVALLTNIQVLNKEYIDFIGQYATIVK